MIKRPLKIVFDASPLLVNKTGVAYYTERLISQLARQYPDEVELVGFYYNFLGRRPTDHFPKAANIRYRPVSFIPSKVIYQLRRFGIEIPLEFLSKERADFVLFTNFLGYPSLFRSPAAPVVHDLTYLDLPEYVSAKNRSDLTRFVPQQIKRSALVVTVSEFSKEKIVKNYGVDAANVVVTPIPPDTSRVYGQAKQQEILHKSGITKPFILFLSTIEPRKNLVGLIDAYESLPEAIRGTHSLVVAGRTGWNCEAEIKRLKQASADGLDVIHLGYTDDDTKWTLFQTTDLYVSASRYEGFGMPVLEAMSYGAPCAVSDIQVFHEVAGDAGVYFDHTKTDDIARAITSVITDEKLRDAMRIKSKTRAQSFKWDTVAASLFKAIEQHLEK
jgi:glycosyltransferase involved in cell wall biosynthesis